MNNVDIKITVLGVEVSYSIPSKDIDKALKRIKSIFTTKPKRVKKEAHVSKQKEVLG